MAPGRLHLPSGSSLSPPVPVHVDLNQIGAGHSGPALLSVELPIVGGLPTWRIALTWVNIGATGLAEITSG
jgi:hypothetical protein